MARPCKLTPAVQEKICRAIRAGSFFIVAAHFAGISERTFRRWMKRGDTKRPGRYAEFRREVLRAEKDSEIALLSLWRKAANDDWHAARSLIQARFPERWARGATKKDPDAMEAEGDGASFELPPEDDDS